MSALVFTFLANAQNQHRYSKSNNVQNSTSGPKDSAEVLLFNYQLEQYLNGNPQSFNMYYFSREEANDFIQNLKNSNYPQIGTSTIDEILLRNAVVKQTIQLYLGDYSKTQMVYFEKRSGFTEALTGFIVKINFGDDDGWSAFINIVLVWHQGTLKILSLKDEY